MVTSLRERGLAPSAARALALLLFCAAPLGGCSATWEGFSRDASSLFGGKEEEVEEDVEGRVEPVAQANTVSVLEIQQLLDEQGYDPGAVDGIFGDRTARAIRSYQLNNDLAVTGRVSGALLEQLRRTSQ